MERILFDIAWSQPFLGGASLLWWVAGGEWYAESKRDWISCCPAFVPMGSGPSGALGVFVFAVLVVAHTCMLSGPHPVESSSLVCLAEEVGRRCQT